jgi:undecaprenyl diphosphate synthase
MHVGTPNRLVQPFSMRTRRAIEVHRIREATAMTASQQVHTEHALLSEARAIVQEHQIKHVGFIVDGNRRWAKERGLSGVAGHRRALEVLLERVKDGVTAGVPVMSFWLFSTENWRRPPDQVRALFDLGREARERLENELAVLGARFQHIGRQDRLPADLLEIIGGIERRTADNKNIQVLAALDYGGRDEIIRAFNRLLSAGRQQVTLDEFPSFLDTAGLPDPDLVIRTSGETRTSGYMTWQAAYSEWVFAEPYFPAFDLAEFVGALRDYANRQRRFGG